MRFSCVAHLRRAVATFEGAPSSFSFPFEGFGETFVTKSGIVVVAIEPSESSTTVGFGAVSETVNETCHLALTIRSHEGFFLKGNWFLIFIFTAKTEEFNVPGTES